MKYVYICIHLVIIYVIGILKIYFEFFSDLNIIIVMLFTCL